MRDIFELYQYIKNKYHNYQKIEYTDTEIIIVFHDELEMKIIVQNYYNFYFNNIFYYNLDWQDVKDAIYQSVCFLRTERKTKSYIS